MSRKSQRARARLRIVGQSDKKCGTCTACCTVMSVTEGTLVTNVETGVTHNKVTFNKPRGVECEHARDAAGCAIYATRPKACREWQCAWLMNLPGLESYATRPDRLGVVVWTERTKLGNTILVEEYTPGAMESRAVERLIDAWSNVAPVIQMLPGNKRKLRMHGEITWKDIEHNGS